MNMLENLNGALEYIEQNLENGIDEHEVAKRAYCSVYHFKRMFSYLAGIPLHLRYGYLPCRNLHR